MTIRNLEPMDKNAVLAMVEDFYHSPGVLNPIPTSNFANAYDEMCCGGSERLRGLVMEVEGKTAGFCSLSFSYSTEAGGPVVLIEELYIAPEFQGNGIGTAVFNLLKEEYKGKAARLRLEVAPENARALALYERIGFTRLPYIQMTMEDF